MRSPYFVEKVLEAVSMRVALEQNSTNMQAEKTASYTNTRETVKTTGSVSGVSVDLYANTMDNDVYKDSPKSKDDIAKAAKITDVDANTDYMIVMSSCMSDEDFASLLKDGVHPGSTEIETVVTIVDKIKAELVKCGQVVAGFNDDIDRETLVEITGSEAFADKLAKSFQEKDIPLTKENVEMAKEVYDRVAEIGDFSEDATKYMIENQLEPTVDNMYMASYSVKAGNDRQGRGYFANDMQGYYSKKAEFFNWENLQPQMEKVIKTAGYEVTDATLMDSAWIIKNGIPFTVETFDIYQKIKTIDFSDKNSDLSDAIAAAIADGKPAMEAVFSNVTSFMEKAASLKEMTDAISDAAVEMCVDSGEMLNLRNLAHWQKQIDMNMISQRDTKKNQNLTEKEKALLTMEEIRLQMSVEANYKLLKSGYQLDISDLTDVVEKLKGTNRKTSEILFGDGDEITIMDKQALYQETIDKTSKIPELPAATISYFVSKQIDFTLNNVYETGTVLKERYEKANHSYETMMTMPRTDLGDSIKKAFRNVDDILQDMEYEINEENRKAVRTLGYNSIPLTDENIKKVIDANRQVANVLEKLTPAAIMKMIRDGENPLNMQMDEVENYLVENAPVLEGTETEKYSSYLYQLEQNNEISNEERDAYIGVCRLIHQINKSDGSVVGSIVNNGMELNFRNILSMVRTKNKGHIQAILDENTGINEGKGGYFNSISMQIERAFQNQIKSLNGYEETMVKYEKEMLSDIQNLKEVSDNIINRVLENDMPITADNLLAANALMNMEYQVYDKIGKKLKNSGELFDNFKEACEKVQDSFGSEEESKKAISDFTEKVQNLLSGDVVENQAKAIDVKELNLLHKQIGMVKQFSENRQYQVPVYSNGSFTTIHLTLVRDDSNISSVDISMDTELYGNIRSKFTQNNNWVEGYLVYENGFDTQSKEMFTRNFVVSLNDAGMQVKRMNFVQSEDVKTQQIYDTKNEKHSVSNQDTKALYTVAKAFIKAVQEVL